jgi:hypothetical protein
VLEQHWEFHQDNQIDRPEKLMLKSKEQFPALIGWDSTRAAIQGYVLIISAIRSRIIEPHLENWHIALSPTSEGIVAADIPFPNSKPEKFSILLNLNSHKLIASTSIGGLREIKITPKLTPFDLARRLVDTMSGFGIQAEFVFPELEDNPPNMYNPDHATAFFTALSLINRIYKQWQSEISAESCPILFWPHDFDLSFKCYGSKKIFYEQDGSHLEGRSHCQFGFLPGDSVINEPYLYARPWPFDSSITHSPLPKESRWYTESWEGSLLPYGNLVTHNNAKELVYEYLHSVYNACKPTLTD